MKKNEQDCLKAFESNETVNITFFAWLEIGKGKNKRKEGGRSGGGGEEEGKKEKKQKTSGLSRAENWFVTSVVCSV